MDLVRQCGKEKRVSLRWDGASLEIPHIGVHATTCVSRNMWIDWQTAVLLLLLLIENAVVRT